MGLTIEKMMVILVIAMFVLGPERLPVYAKKLGELVRSVKRMADGAKDRLKDEMGPEFEDVDWKQLDPRQYDPRRIIRDALVEDEREARIAERRARTAEAAEARRARSGAGADGEHGGADGAETGSARGLRYDDEAT
ncbi:translocase [Leucobacter zeae]|nr:translocase [Leucobacter zeae]